MRYAFAIAALVISGVLLLLGIGQRTFLAGPSEITYTLESSGDSPYAVIAADQFEGVPGQVNVVLEGDDAFFATGADRDVQAWVEPYDHAVFSADTGEKAFTATQVAGVVAEEIPDAADPETENAESEEDDPSESDSASETDAEPLAAAPVNPRGSDLWLDERSVEDAAGELRVPVKLNDGQSAIIASDGEAPLPAQVSVVWVQDRSTPWAGPLLAAGGLFAVIGGILYLLAIDRNRRGLGPQRGRRGPLLGIRNSFSKGKGSQKAAKKGRSSMRAAVPALGVAVALGLTGCSADYWPEIAPDTAVEDDIETTEAPDVVAPVPVTESQIDRIIANVSEVANDADESLDVELLEQRFTGDALRQREANYQIRAKIPDYGVNPPRITGDELDYQLVQSTEGWPRTLLLTVASEKAGDGSEEDGEKSSSPSLALLLTQTEPHENFLVSRVIALHGGIEMPHAAPVEEGTALLSDDLQSLVLAPGEVGVAFASVLELGEESEYYDTFDLADETLLENYGLARAERAQKDAEDADTPLEHSVSAEQGEQPPTALSTGVGGALVATTVVEEQSVDSGGGRYKPQATGALTALSGLEGQQDRIVQVIEHQMLFFVPNKDDGGQIQLLGETSELVSVRK